MTRRTRPPTLALYEATTTRWHGDAPHARHEATCKTCREGRVFFAHVAPDPGRRAQARVERMGNDWLTGHPCRPVYATARKKAA